MNASDERPLLIKKLNALLEREYNSVVQYLVECDPWIPEEHKEAIRKLLRDLAAEDREHAEEVVRIIQVLEGSPLLGHYTKEVVELSYLSIAYSLQRAVFWKRELVDLYESTLPAFSERKDLQSRLAQLRDREANHMARLAAALDRVRPSKPEGSSEAPEESADEPPKPADEAPKSAVKPSQPAEQPQKPPG